VLLSGIEHWRQQHDYDCLVACCRMVLDYLGIDKSEEWLWAQLRADEITPFSNVKKLSNELGLVVEVASRGDLSTFASYVEAGLPILVAVDADLLSEWPHY